MEVSLSLVGAAGCCCCVCGCDSAPSGMVCILSVPCGGKGEGEKGRDEGQIQMRNAKRRKREERMVREDKRKERGRLEEWHSTIYSSTVW